MGSPARLKDTRDGGQPLATRRRDRISAQSDPERSVSSAAAGLPIRSCRACAGRDQEADLALSSVDNTSCPSVTEATSYPERRERAGEHHAGAVVILGDDDHR